MYFPTFGVAKLLEICSCEAPTSTDRACRPTPHSRSPMRPSLGAGAAGAAAAAAHSPASYSEARSPASPCAAACASFLLGHVPVLVADFHHTRGVGDGWSSNLLRPRRTLGALAVVEVPVANHLVGRRSLQTTWTSRGGVLDGRLDDRFDDLLDERVDVLRATK